MNQDTPNILLVNPWICDFAAYDFWAKPIGLLTLASILRIHGYNVYYIDCLDRFYQKAVKTDPHARYGRGPYLKTRIPRPDGLDDVLRNYSRYGIREEWFRDDLLSIPKPDLVLVTSLMTCWHQGVRHAVDIIKEIYPDALVVLGGIYATLCQDHADVHSGADRVITGQAVQHILKLAEKFTGFAVSPKYNPDNPDTYPYLEKIIQAGMNLRFHTPNAVHIQCILDQTAELMHKAGFKTLRLGLETAVFQKRKNFDKKVTEQTISSIEDSIKTVKQNNITPVIAYYSPIPHTAMWEKAVASSRYELESDPVFSNNSILPCRKEPFSWEIISYLKNLAAS